MNRGGGLCRINTPCHILLLARFHKCYSGVIPQIIYYGGGCQDSRDELREFARRTGIPYTSTLMGLGVLPTHEGESLGMLGMHGTYYANYAIDQADLLIALGVRFDDRVTGKLDSFATRSRIIHIDIDTAEIHKNKQAHIPVCADVKVSLQGINRLLEPEATLHAQFEAWRQEVRGVAACWPVGACWETIEMAVWVV